MIDTLRRARHRLALAVFGARRCEDPEDTAEDPCCPDYPDCDLCWFCNGWPGKVAWYWLYRWHVRRVEHGWDG